MKIIFTTDSIYHSLSHFTEISEEVNSMLSVVYDDKEIQEQLKLPGSKFSSSFVKSPQELATVLQNKFPDMFCSMRTDIDGRIRLSFKLGFPIGTTSIIHYTDLTDQEKKTIKTEQRNDCIVKTVEVNRTIQTDECQLILIPQDENYYFCTAFPGELAPPLPRQGENGNLFWETHLFIR